MSSVKGGKGCEWGVWACEVSLYCTDAEFLNVIGTKVLGVFFLAIHSPLNEKFLHPPPPPLDQKWFETGL
jgi:hypothetical protein